MAGAGYLGEHERKTHAPLSRQADLAAALSATLEQEAQLAVSHESTDDKALSQEIQKCWTGLKLPFSTNSVDQQNYVYICNLT